MLNLIYFFPVCGAVIGIVSVLMTCFLLRRKLKRSQHDLVTQLGKTLNQTDLLPNAQELLEDNLQEIIEDLKNQIPMGAMLFTKAVSGKVQGLVKENLLKRMPALKEKAFIYLSSRIEVEKLLLPLVYSELYTLLFYGALMGFLVSLFTLMWVF
ncbi:hypothetical protein DB41_KI00170 [Neochlamydia sp. TUME1]|uniref:hypothetical protein n=1 Tax=Neochlamydia sp. TUME1 TaxID=1478174 RepID=UPI00057C5491|nr:hypothetical protein [Neochlamydia sp. TUME1]KIC72573.1 hypothetical protein DB41_KI00170 [Neochlamydia sp. TUME1]